MLSLPWADSSEPSATVVPDLAGRVAHRCEDGGFSFSW